MAHLSALPGLALAVEVQTGVGFTSDCRPVLHALAQQVFHLHAGPRLDWPQGPAGNGPDVLLELVGCSAVLGPVPAVVHSRGDLVDQERGVLEFEQLDPDHTDIIEA